MKYEKMERTPAELLVSISSAAATSCLSFLPIPPKGAGDVTGHNGRKRFINNTARSLHEGKSVVFKVDWTSANIYDSTLYSMKYYCDTAESVSGLLSHWRVTVQMVEFQVCERTTNPRTHSPWAGRGETPSVRRATRLTIGWTGATVLTAALFVILWLQGTREGRVSGRLVKQSPHCSRLESTQSSLN